MAHGSKRWRDEHMRRGFVVLVIAAMLVSLPLGSAQASVRVRVVSYRFKPTLLTVSKGAKVVWKNVSSTTHTVTAYGKGWSKNVTLSPGGQTGFVFKSAGTYKYYCAIHAHISSNGTCVANAGIPTKMCGKITVG
jgi:plastocyanin